MKYNVFMMDSSILEVPKQVGEAILEAKTPFIRFGNRMINLKGISKIEPNYENNTEFVLPEPKKYNQTEVIKVLNSLHSGVKKFCVENPGSSKAEQIMSRIFERLTIEKSNKNNESAPECLRINEFL